MKKLLWHFLATLKQNQKNIYSQKNNYINSYKWHLALLLLLLLNTTKTIAQLNTYPYTFNFTVAQPTFVSITGSGIALNNTLSNCSSTVTGGVSYSSTGKFWTFTATKCARVIYTVKEGSTARGVIMSNDKNSVTKTTKGANNGCITDTADFNYDGSVGDITVKFAGGSGGSGEAVIAVSVYDAIVLPVTFTSFKLTQQNNAINISWSVGAELNISKYVVEKSSDAITFNEIGSLGVEGASNYSWIDAKQSDNAAYYRIKAVETNGTNIYSKVLKISTSNSGSDIIIGPNPITDKRFALQLNALPQANYTINIFSSTGQLVYSKIINHQGGSASESIQLPSFIKKGIYTLSIASSHTKINKPLFISQ